MASEYHDWEKFIESTTALVDRFRSSVDLDGHEVVNDIANKKTKQKVLEYCIPNQKAAQNIRDTWSSNRRAIPRKGLIFPDGSILTIYIRAKTLPFDKLLEPIRKHVAIQGDNGAMIGFFDQYSYCFYPNSKEADKIGYFRYDFHADSMGDGGLGTHTYFHFHRRLDESFRHATGPLLDVGEVISGLEEVLASKTRIDRLKKVFSKGHFDELLMDMTFEGIQDFREKYFAENKSQWQNFKHKTNYEEFEKRFLT